MSESHHSQSATPPDTDLPASSTPPASSDPPSDLQLHLDTSAVQPVQSIEKRQILSPVSPHPVHISEPSAIPVLKNQMDPAFNSAEAHPYLANSNGADTAVNHASNHLDASSLQQQQPASSVIDASSLLSSLSSSGVLPTTLPVMDSQSSGSPMNTNGNAASEESSHTNGSPSVSKSVGADGNSMSEMPASMPQPPPPTLASLRSNVDLQALLTKISPPTPATAGGNTAQRQQTPSAPQTPLNQPNGAPASQTSSVPQTPTSALPANAPIHSPTSSKPRTTSNPPPPPVNHPLPPAPVVSSSVPGHPPSAYPASLPPPPKFAQQSPGSADGEENEEEDKPFTAEEEQEYLRFIDDERDYVTQGQWDRFPPGSRLFIGNLPTEKVTKRDLFRIFHKHGRLAQVSIKQAYGFIQFLDQQSCANALRHEQGSAVRGRKMHLEISKPQRNNRNNNDGARRGRSRSPDYPRGNSPRRAGSYRGREGGVDRYRSAPRDRDDYGRRSPLPRYGRRDDYRPGRRSRSRSRTRSRSPPRYRPRSRTPELDDDVPLPRRPPSQVPEVQVLVSDELERNFIWWVENAFTQRGLKVDMLYLNPRLQLSAVVKRQVIEGVTAVVFLNRQMMASSRISIQVFDRRGEGEATFDQYDNLEPQIAAELVVRAKKAHQALQQSAPVTATYGSYGVPPQAQPAPVQPQQILQQLGAIPNIGNILSSLDPNALQKLLAGLQQGQQVQQPQMQQTAPQLDLSSLLAGAARPQVPAQQAPQAYAPSTPTLNNGYGGTAGLAALLSQAQQNVAQAPQQQQQPQQKPGQPAPAQIGNIMETLAKWKQA